MQTALKALMQAGRQCFDWINTLGPFLTKIKAAGFPFGAGGATKAPFDVISDSLRGTSESMMDLYRRPEKVLEAMQRFVRPMIELGAGSARVNRNPMVFIFDKLAGIG